MWLTFMIISSHVLLFKWQKSNVSMITTLGSLKVNADNGKSYNLFDKRMI